MSAESTEELLKLLRKRGYEAPNLEVKAAVGGLPKSIWETFSAFSNDSGGAIFLGLTDPAQGAQPAQGFEAERTVQQLESALRDLDRPKITPPIRPLISIEPLKTGQRIVRVDVPEGPPQDKPYYVTSQGRYSGSYTRIGEGDRKLDAYEIDRMLENTGQPAHDREPVEEASLEDLNPENVQAYINNLKSKQPRAFAHLSDEDALKRTGVLVRSENSGPFVPSLAGLLALGDYPQEYFPQLDISVVVLPTNRMGETLEDGVRFLDNRQCSGPIPFMIEDALDVLRRNMRSRSVLVEGGIGRKDVYDYPVEVMRELLANAVMHRDYSPGARGSQIQVELYPDRLLVRSPGGIYGPVDVRQFGEPNVSSSRNALLARLLADLPAPRTHHMVAENRGSGIPSVYIALRNSGMRLPDFSNTLKRLEVSVYSSVESEKNLNHTNEKPLESARVGRGPVERQEEIIKIVSGSSEGLTLSDIQARLKESGYGASRITITKDLNKLEKQKKVSPTAPPRSKNRRYVISQGT